MLMFLQVTSDLIFELTKQTNSTKLTFWMFFNYVFRELISNKIYEVTNFKSILYFLDMASMISFSPKELRPLEKVSFEFVFSRDSLRLQFVYIYNHTFHIPCDRYM